MKSGILALSMLATGGLVADGDYSSNQPNNYAQGSCNTCCKCPSECKPCCVPKPKKCIDCECYVPAYYDLQCDWGAFLTVDFLYWYARETNLTYAAVGTAQEVANPEEVFGLTAPTTRTHIGNTSYKNLNTDWEPGVRVGLGWNSDCDGWDAFLNWTYMHNTRKDSTSVAEFNSPDYSTVFSNNLLPAIGQSVLLNQWVDNGFNSLLTLEPGGIGTLFFTSVSAKWKLSFNQIDLEFGRKYWLSRCFTLRPYGGLRGAWIKTKFQTISSRDPVNEETYGYSFKDSFTNKSWGVGLLGGLQPNWHFCSNFILYSNFDMALIWGEYQAKKKENYAGTGTSEMLYSNSSSSSFYRMQAVLDLAIGFRWEENWCCDRYKTALDLGWEHHIWFDHNHRIKSDEAIVTNNSQITGNRSFDEATGDLGLGGLVIRLRFDF